MSEPVTQEAFRWAIGVVVGALTTGIGILAGYFRGRIRDVEIDTNARLDKLEHHQRANDEKLWNAIDTLRDKLDGMVTKDDFRHGLAEIKTDLKSITEKLGHR